MSSLKLAIYESMDRKRTADVDWVKGEGIVVRFVDEDRQTWRKSYHNTEAAYRAARYFVGRQYSKTVYTYHYD